MKYAEIAETAHDTVWESHERGESAQYYVRGHDPSGSIEPHWPVPAIIYTVSYQHDNMWGHAVVLWRETNPGHFDGFECVEVWDIHH